MNAANEIAVDAFLNQRIGFMDIARTVSDALDKTDIVTVESVEHVFDIDQQARQLATSLIR
jgi:1-deoxy-D-xylulose-5-phosphate reductoisomerase